MTTTTAKNISPELLTSLSLQAAASHRKRAHHNLHPVLADPIQRLAIAMEPGTYVRPHRHPHTFELLIPLRGEFVALYFDDSGKVTARTTLGGTSGVALMEHAPGQWHAVVSMTPGAVIFEVKGGPYIQVPKEDLASWSPEEGTPDAEKLISWFRAAEVGSVFTK